MKLTAALGPVQETMLIPLYGRAVLTRQGDPLISDPKAVEIVDAIDYDFAKFDGLVSLVGSALRTRIHDHWVAGWLAHHPTGTVVEIGAGLNTRFERLDNGRLHWIDLDLPDAIALRRSFFDDTDRRRMVATSITDPGWIEHVQTSPGPWFFVAEAVLIYLSEPDVRRAFELLATRFPGAALSFDTFGTWMRDHADQHESLRHLDARLAWFCDDPHDIETWPGGLRIIESRTLPQSPPPVLDLLSADARALMAAMADDPQVSCYRQNLATAPGRVPAPTTPGP